MKKNLITKIFERKTGILLLVLTILVVGGLGGVFFDRLVLPYLSTVPVFRNIGFLQSDAPIVINRREEIRINEGINQLEVVNRTKPSLVTVYSYTGDFEGPVFEISRVVTGVVVSSDGYIVVPSTGIVTTGQNQMRVVFADGRHYDATLAAQDALTGLSFVKIIAQNLSVIGQEPAASREAPERLMLVDSSEALPAFSGIPVTLTQKAIGPIGFVPLLDVGVLHAYLEIDTQVDETHLGAVVVDKDAELVGIVTQIGNQIRIVRTEDFKMTIDNFFEDQVIDRTSFRMSYRRLGSAQLSLMGIDHQYGAMVVSAPSPLLADDIVIAVDGQRLSAEEGLQDMVLRKKTGDEMQATLLREGSERTVTITLP